jgi:hypothetical protein
MAMAMSMRTIPGVLFALGLGCGGAGAAQPDSTGAPPAARPDGASAPARADDPFLANLVGRWEISRRIRGTEVHNHLDAHWVLQHRFIVLHMIDADEPPKYEAIVLMGYDTAHDRYVAHWTDTYGAQSPGVGYGKRVGNAVDFVFPSPEGNFHNTFTWDPVQRTWRSLMESEGRDGKRTFFAEDTYLGAD